MRNVEQYFNNTTVKPEFIIYKQDYPIGQALTWHKALGILVEQEGLTDFTVIRHQQLLSVYSSGNYYKIVKER